MAKTAKRKGLKYLAVTDHCDYDYLAIDGYEYFHQLDLEGYLKEIEKIKEQVEGLDFAVGLELGYHREASKRYLDDIPFDRFDYIINSVHSIGNHDVYFPSYFENKDREKSYKDYLLGVLDSLYAPYPYNTVGHIGYVAKNSLYDDKDLLHSDFPDLIDEILKGIINKDKTLEINANYKNGICMPDISIIKRYKELGGDNITYGSDAHKLSRLCHRYAQIAALIRELGFKHWTVYKNMQPYKIEI